jgi:hypothetical protein
MQARSLVKKVTQYTATSKKEALKAAASTGAAPLNKQNPNGSA